MDVNASVNVVVFEVDHPGRGKYLIKTGDRPGLPVAMSLIGDEHRLYDTDAATRRIAP